MLKVCYDSPIVGEVVEFEIVPDQAAADRLIEKLARFSSNFERSRFIVIPA